MDFDLTKIMPTLIAAAAFAGGIFGTIILSIVGNILTDPAKAFGANQIRRFQSRNLRSATNQCKCLLKRRTFFTALVDQHFRQIMESHFRVAVFIGNGFFVICLANLLISWLGLPALIWMSAAIFMTVVSLKVFEQLDELRHPELTLTRITIRLVDIYAKYPQLKDLVSDPIDDDPYWRPITPVPTDSV